MPVQTFVPDVPLTAGKELTEHTGLSNADTFTFLNDGNTKLIVRTKEAVTKVTVTVVSKVDGQEVKSREVEIGKNKAFVFGSFDKSKYNNPETEKVEFKLSVTTEVTVEVVKG
jgi:hypothetical protein